MLELVWIVDKEHDAHDPMWVEASNDGDTQECATEGCRAPVGWTTHWSSNWRTGGDEPHPRWEDTAMVGGELYCCNCGEKILADCFAKEVEDDG